MADQKTNAQNLRITETTSEGLLWSILRSSQLCGLKFRRQHPIRPWVADFACVAKSLVIEIDGGYHDAVREKDLHRQADLESRGWTVLRYTDKDVEEDAEAVARAIAAHLQLDYEFVRRQKTGSGMKNVRAKKPKRKAKPE